VPSPSESEKSELLARRWFAAVERRAFDELTDLLHEEVRVVSRIEPGRTIEGRAGVARFIAEKVSVRLYEALPEVYAPIDDSKIVVEGRMRWIDDERVIRDDPTVWALEFRDDLLYRFLPARSTLEAEGLLSAQG
jgi:hypothetical protein